MTLEPVHMHKISELAERIDRSFELDETKTAAGIYKLLEELKIDEKVILKAVDRLFRGMVRTELIAQGEDPYPVTYACDSGSTNPKTYDSGLFVDFCHCGLAATPTDLDVQRCRTIVCAAYSSSRRIAMRATAGWETFDEGLGRAKLVTIAPDELKRKAPDMVHSFAMYLAESEHLLFMKDRLEPESFFIMDGPIYPKQLMYWMVLDDAEVRIRQNPDARKILQNYIDVMDHFLEMKIPVIGFVKNPTDMQIMDSVRKKREAFDLPWLLDAQFFKNVLSLEKAGGISGNGHEGRYSNNNGNDGNNCRHYGSRSAYLTYTNWFLQPNRYYEKMLKGTSPLAAGDMIQQKLRHRFSPEDYALCFFMLYVPSKDVVFKVEAPYGLIKDDFLRMQITKKVLFDVSLHGFPLTLTKADHLAKIRKVERQEIDKFFESMSPDTTYNDTRWGKFNDI
ncbi:DNA double-strand break repair nuclease NurA [Methanosarcina mazei]|uniref:Nuclease n=1 Tax=Methanosarcina mazei TaxID=2209 RepID=A0A0F8E4H9_METMZ|nr:DNA double-strand break repair nuclease NurA [Methanosarcina mazei]KKG01501.1 nuclease [Methanosarcina mazei]KKG33757.1 nuclease [Methanosarcina mazei]KKG35582.1 nuclease [Methanosarcina mazei]KKG64260.1 nuclease [Methanosarcina mazei]KKG83732.1 nuclease [Methanosarcina mazei]